MEKYKYVDMVLMKEVSRVKAGGSVGERPE